MKYLKQTTLHTGERYSSYCAPELLDIQMEWRKKPKQHEDRQVCYFPPTLLEISPAGIIESALL